MNNRNFGMRELNFVPKSLFPSIIQLVILSRQSHFLLLLLMELLIKGSCLGNRKCLILLLLCGLSSYGTYKLYRLPSLSRKTNRFLKLLGALISILEMVSDTADTLTLVSKDLKEFLGSNSDQIPNSLKQLSKIAASHDFSNSLTRVCQAATSGLIQGYRAAEGSSEIGKVEDKLMSKAGTGFVSVVVGSFARNLVLGFYSSEGINGNYDSGLKIVSSPQWVDLLSRDKSKLVMADCINTFVSTAVAAYLDRTANFNLYDDIFSGLTDPKHQKQVKDIVVYIFSGAVETFIKTSHQVLTSSKSSDFCC